MKLLNTNTEQYKANLEAYIFDCIEEGETIEDKLAYAMSEFKRVANYPSNIYNIPNEVDRFADYLQGLPFNFEYSYDSILEVTAKLHEIDIVPANKEQIIKDNYFKHIAHNIIKLNSKHNKEEVYR